jgi:hypothetical protein
MPRVKLVIEDDDGKVIANHEVDLDVKSGSFHDIEGAVEEFRREALPRLERELLRRRQSRLRAEKGGP